MKGKQNEKIKKELYLKYKEIINYLIFGVLTTLVSFNSILFISIYIFKSIKPYWATNCKYIILGSRSSICIFYKQKICIWK